MAAKLNIHGTEFLNTPEGVAALLKSHRDDVLMRERARVEDDARRAAGNYGKELDDSAEAFRVIDLLDYPDGSVSHAANSVRRALNYGLSATGKEYVNGALDDAVEWLTTYAANLTIQIQNVAWSAYTIRNGTEPADDWSHTS